MTKKYKSVFDIPVKGVDGEDNFLEQFKGKTLMFVNTTGHCGNAPQWPIIEEIQNTIGTENFRVIYVPTNDYCGSVTYGEFKHGIQHGKESQQYAYTTYGVESPFTELVSSRDEFWIEKNLEFDYQAKDWDWSNNTGLLEEIQSPKSELYQFLTPHEDLVKGNFHKIITNSEGIPVASFHNGTLLPFAKEWGSPAVLDPEDEKKNMLQVIKDVIETGSCSLARYKYEPYAKVDNS